MQLIVFGFAINMDPKHLPAAIHSAEDTFITRALLKGFENSGYPLYRDYDRVFRGRGVAGQRTGGFCVDDSRRVYLRSDSSAATADID